METGERRDDFAIDFLLETGDIYGIFRSALAFLNPSAEE
jgi:hypothetical protein